MSNIIKSSNEGIYIISKIIKCKLTEEKYDFLLNVYSQRKEFFEIVVNNIDNVNFSDLTYIYNKNFEVLSLLLNSHYFSFVNKEFYDILGDNIILENKNILQDLVDVPLNEIKPFVEKIKLCPSNLKVFLEVRKSNYKGEYNIILDNLGNKNLEKIWKIIKNLKDSLLKKFLLDNINDLEVVQFSEYVANNCHGSLEKLKKFNYENYVKYLKNVNPNLDDNFIKKFVIYQVRQNKNDSEFLSVMYEALLNYQKYDDLKIIIDEAIKNGMKLGDECQKVLKVYELLNPNLSIETRLQNFEHHYKTSDLNLDYFKFYEWVKNYKSELISENLINPGNLKDNSTIDYLGYDEFGYLKTYKIPVKVIDNPNFHILIHSITKKEDNSLNRVANYHIGNQLIDNPSLWNSVSKNEGNPQISTSFFNGWLRTFGDGSVILGFSHIDGNNLIATFDRDAGTQMKENHEKIIIDNKSIFFAEQDKLENNTLDYNEILLKRYKDGKPILPDYVIVESDKINTKIETAKKWAAYFNVPIVIIDKNKIGEVRKNNVENILKKIIEAKHFDFNTINKLKDEIRLTNWCFEHNCEKKIDPYDVIIYLLKNMQISSTNALSFLELMHSYEFSKFNVHMNHTIVQSEVSSLNKFLPINVDPLKRNLFIDVAKKRQIEMSTYIELCKSTINELYYSFDEYPEYSTGKSI